MQNSQIHQLILNATPMLNSPFTNNPTELLHHLQKPTQLQHYSQMLQIAITEYQNTKHKTPNSISLAYFIFDLINEESTDCSNPALYINDIILISLLCHTAKQPKLALHFAYLYQSLCNLYIN